jgi:hypothetical protein
MKILFHVFCKKIKMKWGEKNGLKIVQNVVLKHKIFLPKLIQLCIASSSITRILQAMLDVLVILAN